MKYYKIDYNNPDKSILKKAAAVIKSGGLVVYPTDTLYGFGVNIFNDEAMDRLFKIKQRHTGKPISILLNDIKQAEKLIGNLSLDELKAAKLFFPGKITLLFERKIDNKVPRLNHLKKIGFRIPDSKLTQLLVDYVGSPISTTSANISTKDNVKDIEELISSFGDTLDLILDAGPVKDTKGSSVLDMTTEPPTLLRKGEIPRKEIVKKLGYDISTNYSRKFVITFVCSGNICRSPMAAGILKKLLARTKFKDVVEVNSAGTLKLPESMAHVHAARVSQTNGIDIDNHLSRHIQGRIIREANIIFALALDHTKYLKSHFPEFKNKVVLLKQWKKMQHLTNPSVADPIGHEIDTFEETFKEIQKEMKRVFPAILNQIKNYVQDNSIIL